jgi:colicin import membrane protein
VLEKTKRRHEHKVTRIEAKRAALDVRLEAEKALWEKQKQKLEAAVDRARD